MSEQQQIIETTINNRGSNIGRRGRGGRNNRGGERQNVNTYTNRSMLNYVNGFTVMVNPVRNYYLLDIRNILILFLNVDEFIRRQPTRIPWMHLGYYTGIMMYCLGARLQRIAHATSQCFFNNNELIQVADVMMPTTVCTLIEQFGPVEDDHGNWLCPKITPDTILLIHRIAYDLMTNGGVCAVNGVLTLVNNDYFSFINESYGGAYAATLGLCMLSSVLSLSCPVSGISAYDRNQLAAYIASIENQKAGANLIPPMINYFFPINNAPNAQLDALFSRAGVIPPIGAPFPLSLVNAITLVRNEIFQVNVGAFPFGPGFQSNTLVNDPLIPFSDMIYIAELTKLRVVFNCRTLNQDVTGTKAPLVGTERSGTVKPTALMVNTSAQEFYYGCVLSNWVVTITPTDRYYNVENPSRRRFRYIGSPTNETLGGLRGSLIQTDVLTRK